MLSSYSNIYFIGIGGIGMSALARYFKQMGKQVGGYDKTETELTKQLENEGIKITYQDELNTLPEVFKNRNQTLVVYTPAVPSNHVQLNYFRKEQFHILKRAQLLGIITQETPTLAVCGTHGKTTTGTLLAHLFKNAKRNVTAFLGGISQNYNTNMLIGNPKGPEHLIVTEADEYDRSFHNLYPQTIICTSLDADHLDIYNSKEEMLEAYAHFFKQIKSDGYFIYNYNLTLQIPKNCKAFSYSLNNYKASAHTDNLRLENDKYIFDLITPLGKIENISISYPGLHNIENAVAASLAALLNGLQAEDVKNGLRSFKGVKRRFEIHLKNSKHIVIDDYAHHPEELKTFLNSVKSFYPNKKITILFQPHLYSRTRDFGDDFANALAIADDIMLLEIYPARETPIEGINSKWLADKIKNKPVLVVNAQQTIEQVKNKKPELLLTVGAGDINLLIPDLINALHD